MRQQPAHTRPGRVHKGLEGITHSHGTREEGLLKAWHHGNGQNLVLKTLCLQKVES